ncbi:hypothetical protein [Rhodococcus zopfii]|uniref:hypothetical protein n=1 Tax=Rhodococcus zopfii TaxID=43772 RepID=UPI0035293DCB
MPSTPKPCRRDAGVRRDGDPAERAAGKLTLTTIRDDLARIVAQRVGDDPNLYCLDGTEL